MTPAAKRHLFLYGKDSIIIFFILKVMAQVSQSKLKGWLFNKALASKEAGLKKLVLLDASTSQFTVFTREQIPSQSTVKLLLISKENACTVCSVG